ncbi:MAG: ATP-binding cassette domain-containing protein, partial [Polyangiaceae bacterium]|nr:ATP-binding cassette domain-containing protein [Polyangiaceae bacterium]
MASKGERLIELDGITKIFTTDEVETHALSGVYLTIDKGEWISVIGPSGSGKSTLLAILGLLDTPSGGKYTLRGAPAAGLSAAEMSRLRNQEIGFIFQTFNLIGDLTVYENVELPLVYRRVPPEERRERVMRALDRVDISHRAHHLP